MQVPKISDIFQMGELTLEHSNMLEDSLKNKMLC